MCGCMLSSCCSMVFLTLSPIPLPFSSPSSSLTPFPFSFPLPSHSPFWLSPPPPRLNSCIHPFSSLASRGYHFSKFVPCSFLISSFQLYSFSCTSPSDFIFFFSLSFFILYSAVHFFVPSSPPDPSLLTLLYILLSHCHLATVSLLLLFLLFLSPFSHHQLVWCSSCSFLFFCSGAWYKDTYLFGSRADIVLMLSFLAMFETLYWSVF